MPGRILTLTLMLIGLILAAPSAAPAQTCLQIWHASEAINRAEGAYELQSAQQKSRTYAILQHSIAAMPGTVNECGDATKYSYYKSQLHFRLIEIQRGAQPTTERVQYIGTLYRYMLQAEAKVPRRDPAAATYARQVSLLYQSASLPMPTFCETPFREVEAVLPVTPEYPEQAKEAGLGAVTVVVQVSVDATGAVTDTKVTQSSSNMALDRAAQSAARQTQYRPKLINCMPVAGTYKFIATFMPNS